MTWLRRNPGPLLPLGTMTLVVAGCAEEPFTASDFVSRGPPTPQSTFMSLPGSEDVIAQWQLPSGDPWAPYEKFTLPTALDQARGVGELPDIMSLEDVRTGQCAAARAAEAGLPLGTMWVVDLRGAASVAFGSALSRRSARPVAVVPTFNNWPVQNGLVPAEETLAAMVSMPPRALAPGTQASVPVFLLDAWRLAYKEDTIEEPIVDNRYMLSAGDLPSAQVLHAQGIRHVIYVVEDGGAVATEEDDLNDLFASYQDIGIEIDLVDLAWLCQAQLTGWPGGWLGPGAYPLRVVPRSTVVHDRRFYARARGGFGGIHARPSGGAPVFGGRSSAGGVGGG
jgi:hypothetical protein